MTDVEVSLMRVLEKLNQVEVNVAKDNKATRDWCGAEVRRGDDWAVERHRELMRHQEALQGSLRLRIAATLLSGACWIEDDTINRAIASAERLIAAEKARP